MAQLKRDAEFTEYLHARTPWLRRIAYLLCHDWHRADDLTQDALLKLYVHWDRARKAEHFDGYVRSVLVNTFLNEQQTTWWKRISLSGSATSRETEEDIAQVLAGDIDASLDLIEALAGVPPRQRAVLVLRYYCDLSVAQTAEALRCSPGTVKSQASRGLEALRAVLNAQPAI
jgi:RNA polymerase sigma-70 factor (sigma-E family)